ncbi:phosphopantetheine-binding protein [Streptomyces luteireticuli]|uniref:Carrier domain-containing protein n=1 Tax=Streptomyces luteireticuli TaxID=173858 RepID=A0ABP3IF43_9ACTN
MSETAPAVVDLEELRQLLAVTFDLPAAEITDKAHFVQDLGMDSLITLEIATRLEDRYAIEMSDDELKAISTLLDVRDLLERKLADA